MPGEFTHEGETITVNPIGEFHSEMVGSFPTLVQCKEALHKAKGDAARYDLNLTVLNAAGEKVVLKRIHQGTGNWLSSVGGVSRSVYHDCPASLAAMENLREANELRDQAVAELAGFRIELPGWHGHRDDRGIVELQEYVRSTIEAGPVVKS